MLLTEMEHHSDIVPWQLVAPAPRLPPSRSPDRARRQPRPRADASATGTRAPASCTLTQASNVLGTINDVKAVATLAHERRALVLVDAAQSVPHMSVDVRDLGCDFLAFSGHKAYGPMGIGVLYGRESLLEAMPPVDGRRRHDPVRLLERSTWNDLPWKFEAGTPNVVGAIGLGAAIDYVERLGWDAIQSREEELSSYARAARGGRGPISLRHRAAPLPGLLLQSRRSPRPRPRAVPRQRGVAVRAGHHCAQPLMRVLGIPAAVRASLAFYNAESEIDRLAEGLRGASRFYA